MKLQEGLASQLGNNEQYPRDRKGTLEYHENGNDKFQFATINNKEGHFNHLEDGDFEIGDIQTFDNFEDIRKNIGEKIDILTHSGVAHLDEILAIGALAYARDLDVNDINLTRNRNPDKIENIQDYIIDVGRNFDSLNGRFDHHQGGEKVEGKSSLGLIIDSIPELEIIKNHPFVKRVDFQDNNGLEAGLKKNIGVDIASDAFKSQYELLESMMCEKMASQNESDQKFAIQIAKETIAKLVNDEKSLNKAEELLENKAQVNETKGVRTLMCFARISNDTMITNRALERFSNDNNCHLILTKNHRGMTINRTKLGEGVGIDLNNIDGLRGVKNIHHNGFTASLSDPKLKLKTIINSLGVDLSNNKN